MSDSDQIQIEPNSSAEQAAAVEVIPPSIADSTDIPAATAADDTAPPAAAAEAQAAAALLPPAVDAEPDGAASAAPPAAAEEGALAVDAAEPSATPAAPEEMPALAATDGGLEGIAPHALRTAVTESADPDQPLLDIRARRRARPSVWALGALGASDISAELTESTPMVVQQASEPSAEPGGPGVGDEDWVRAQELLDAQEVFEARISGYNLGGVTTTFGRLRGFIPNSHLSMIQPEMSTEQQQAELSKLVGKTIPVRIIEVQRKRRRLVLSERLAERAWREKQRDKILNQIEVGQIVTGRVRSLTSFGVFVDIGGADGLIHLSELTWKRIKHPREIVRVGQELTMEVIRVERERGRVGLSLKHTQPNPWADIEARYHPGQLITARVTNLVTFGAFAAVEPGVEGLVHISELSDDYIEHPRQVVQRGQEYTMRVLAIDREHERVSLSLRQAPQWIEAPSPTVNEEDMPHDD